MRQEVASVLASARNLAPQQPLMSYYTGERKSGSLQPPHQRATSSDPWRPLGQRKAAAHPAIRDLTSRDP